MIRRCGNFGFVDDGSGAVYSFNMGAMAGTGGWTPTQFHLRGAGVTTFGWKYMDVNGHRIIPYGSDNDLPGRVMRLLEKFYAGEGIMGKKAGLQWGEGPRLYTDAVDADNSLYRQWLINPELTKELEQADYETQMHRCLIDLCHLEGFWVKFIRNRGGRIGEGKILRVEHVPAGKVRFIWRGDNLAPTHAMVSNWPLAEPSVSRVYPLFDPKDPMKYGVSLAYYNVYSYNHDHYSIPRFVGAFDWLELAGTLAPLLATYNANASAISKHIESPNSYWEEQRKRIEDICRRTGEPYTDELLEKFKDDAMEMFAARMSGKENAGKFLHTSQFWNEEARQFEGWKITSIDNKVKEYIEAQVAICKKSEAAATSGFGLDPSLSNLILDTKLGSGSEKLYALKVYNATETCVPDMVLCRPWQQMVEANHPGCGIKVGLYRRQVEAEKNVNPGDRVKANE